MIRTILLATALALSLTQAGAGERAHSEGGHARARVGEQRHTPEHASGGFAGAATATGFDVDQLDLYQIDNFRTLLRDVDRDREDCDCDSTDSED